MKLDTLALLYVVGNQDGLVTVSTLRRVIDMVNGGLDLDEVQLFTVEREANLAGAAQKRRSQVREFSDHAVLSSAKLALLDESGGAIDTVGFCSTDHETG